MAHADLLLEECLGALLEFVGILGGEVLAGAAASELLAQVRVVVEVLGQAVGHVFGLRNDAHAGFDILQNLRKEDGIVGAAQDDGVDGGVLAHELVDALLDEIVGAGTVGFVVLYEGNPEGAGYAADTDIGKEFIDFDIVAVAAHGALGSQQAYVATVGERPDNFGRRSDDAQHAAGGIPRGQVVLLDGSQGFGRGGVAAQDDQLAAHAEEFQHGLARELIYDVE